MAAASTVLSFLAVNGDTTLASTEGPVSHAARDETRAHIRDHARKEAARIDKLSRVREFVLGAQDGLLVPLGVVTGMAAANPGRSAILVAGIAEGSPGASRWAAAPTSQAKRRRGCTPPR